MSPSASVSVVLPTRNAQNTLGAALDSVLNQTFRALEVIVVDDGSSDATWNIAGQRVGADPRVRLIRAPGEGLAHALNLGIEAASAPLIARMDSDDVAAPQRIARQVALFEQHPEVVVAGSFVRMFSNDLELRCARPGHLLRYPVSADEVATALLTNNPFCHPTVMMRRDAVLAVGGYRGIFPRAEDYDLWTRLMERGQGRNLPEPLLYYRISPGSVSSRWHQDQEMQALAVRACLRARKAGRAEPIDCGRVDFDAVASLLDLSVTDLRYSVAKRSTKLARRMARCGLHAEAAKLRRLALSDVHKLNGWRQRLGLQLRVLASFL